MKIRNLLFVALLATQVAGLQSAKAQQTGAVNDTVIMGASYANEVYYSMTEGKQGTAARNQWDIAFRSAVLSASIITNDGTGVVLYTYPNGDTTDWAAIDTAGLSTWKPLYNSLTDWETGAFNTHSAGQLDYGWGVYNMVTHNLSGDSIYIIKLRNGSLRKLWIESKASALNIYTFRYAAINGTDEHKVTLDCGPYTSKNFVGYSLADNKVVDYEPVAGDKWDLLFTKYMGINNNTPYIVTGALSNYKTGVANYKHVSLDFGSYVPGDIKMVREGVGYDWKQFVSMTYKIVDSSVYFVQDRNNAIHKLIFKEFAGSSTGRIVLSRQVLGTVGLSDRDNPAMNAVVYPNPVSETLNLVINPGKASKASITISNSLGKVVFVSDRNVQPGTLSTLQCALPQLAKGMYVVTVKAGTAQVTRKIVINQ